MTASEKLRQMLTESQGAETWLNWFKDDITQLVLAAAREQARPRQLPLGSDALLITREYGRSAGANELLDIMTDPTVGAGTNDRQSTPLVPDYGAGEILNEERY